MGILRLLLRLVFFCMAIGMSIAHAEGESKDVPINTDIQVPWLGTQRNSFNPNEPPYAQFVTLNPIVIGRTNIYHALWACKTYWSAYLFFYAHTLQYKSPYYNELFRALFRSDYARGLRTSHYCEIVPVKKIIAGVVLQSANIIIQESPSFLVGGKPGRLFLTLVEANIAAPGDPPMTAWSPVLNPVITEDQMKIVEAKRKLRQSTVENN